MADKRINGRIINKHDTEANWSLATEFIPEKGELIVYDVDETYVYERFKIGDGIHTVVELPFAMINIAPPFTASVGQMMVVCSVDAEGRPAEWECVDQQKSVTSWNDLADTPDLSVYYLKAEADALHSNLEQYVDTEVAALVNSAPETLDTIGELAAAFQKNDEVVEALDASITNKQDKVSDTLVLVDTVTGLQHKIQIQNGQLVSFPIE